MRDKKSLQAYTYLYTSIATFWTYDYACSLHQEWTFLLRSRWSKVKCLYIATRYVPFLLLAGNLYLNFMPNKNSDTCKMLNNICSCFSLISVTCSEFFFVLRTYALWNNHRFVLATTLTAIVAVIVASVSVSFATTATESFATSVVPGITGCYQSSASVHLFIPFLLLLLLELVLMTLTLVRAIQNWRTTKSHMYAVLVKHNIFYYACGLFFSTVNVLATLLLHYDYHVMFQDLQFFVLAILATRMHRHLWHIDRRVHAFVLIPMSDMYSAAGTT
ncbi:uncharacterized protein EDB91DRAFT_386534 [Suillus paluster]|uniref:uncharacterized protein n=1 Tax=Suillus paluster TaxID=48578 RepID=UPI001B86A902|nr:uncharacterized protein EDB91DRAFT_386534 [Suillus paluster]KAG1739461.1 hypothetical protein EDB91DRAFT_386534 [Suillus paluster]